MGTDIKALADAIVNLTLKQIATLQTELARHGISADFSTAMIEVFNGPEVTS